MKYRGREVWEDFKIITAVCPKDTALALAGSVFVAGAWFLIQFVNSCLLRTVAKFGQEKGHAAVLLLFLLLRVYRPSWDTAFLACARKGS